MRIVDPAVLRFVPIIRPDLWETPPNYMEVRLWHRSAVFLSHTSSSPSSCPICLIPWAQIFEFESKEAAREIPKRDLSRTFVYSVPLEICIAMAHIDMMHTM